MVIDTDKLRILLAKYQADVEDSIESDVNTNTLQKMKLVSNLEFDLREADTLIDSIEDLWSFYVGKEHHG